MLTCAVQPEMKFRGPRQQQAEMTEPRATPQHQYEKHFAPADHLMASAAADFGNPSVDRPRRAACWAPLSAGKGTIQQASSPVQIIQRQELSSQIRFRLGNRLQQRLSTLREWKVKMSAHPALLCDSGIGDHLKPPPACNLSEVTEGSSDSDLTRADFTQTSITLQMILILHQYKKNPVDTPTVFFQNYLFDFAGSACSLWNCWFMIELMTLTVCYCAY